MEHPNRMDKREIEEMIRQYEEERKRLRELLKHCRHEATARDLRLKIEILTGELAFWRTILGKKRASNCKAFVSREVNFYGYKREEYRCLLKKRVSFWREDIYRLCCARCSLTTEQIEVGCLVKRIAGDGCSAGAFIPSRG